MQRLPIDDERAIAYALKEVLEAVEELKGKVEELKAKAEYCSVAAPQKRTGPTSTGRSYRGGGVRE